MRYNNFRGEYDANAQYEKNDVVIFDGAAYYRLFGGKGVSPIGKARRQVWQKMNETAGDVLSLVGGPSSPSGGGGTSDAVQYIPQELTESQQMQARKNLGLSHVESVEVDWGSALGIDPFPVTLETVVDDGSQFAMVSSELMDLPLLGGVGAGVKVTFDNVEYMCEVRRNDQGLLHIGSEPPFEDYPFLVIRGALVTKNPGEHTIDFTVYADQFVPGDYGDTFACSTETDSDGNERLNMSTLNKVVDYVHRNIPVKISVNFGVRHALHVTYYAGSFIYLSSAYHDGKYNVRTYAAMISCSDGLVTYKASCSLGEINDNGNNYPVLYINNRNYKVDVDDNGALIATLLS